MIERGFVEIIGEGGPVAMLVGVSLNRVRPCATIFGVGCSADSYLDVTFHVMLTSHHST